MKTQIITTIAMAALFVGCSDNRYGNTTNARDAKVAQQFADLPAGAQAAQRILERRDNRVRSGAPRSALPSKDVLFGKEPVVAQKQRASVILYKN